ncbi:MAG: DUF4810 domain-containing protein [Bacteroidales bacterium]|nr:DUF4810 domain-containing protein [Bacteroidales bacterium]
MKRHYTTTVAALMAGCLTLAACINQGTMVDVPSTLMNYQHKPTEARLLAVAKSYAEAINRNLKEQAPYPGQYADYGVALARLGCLEQANIMFNNEKMLFPNSSPYVDKLKATLTPALKGDNRVDTSAIDLRTLDTITVHYTPEEEALLRQQADDPEFKRMMKEQAREERERQVMLNKKAREQARQERERQAQQDKQAREQERQEREKAIQAQREAEREAQKAQREAQREEQKALREAQREAQQAQREAQKAQREAERQAKAAEKAVQDSIARAAKEIQNQ